MHAAGIPEYDRDGGARKKKPYSVEEYGFCCICGQGARYHM